MTGEPSLAEQLEFWKHQAAFWKARALVAEGARPVRVSPESDTHRRIDYRDPTGDRAASRADRASQHHGKQKRPMRR